MRCVQEGNCMAWRCALLCFLALARGIWVILEQPKGSLLEAHPAMQALFKTCYFWRKSIRMGDFAASSQKDTWLYSSQILNQPCQNKSTLILNQPCQHINTEGVKSNLVAKQEI